MPCPAWGNVEGPPVTQAPSKNAHDHKTYLAGDSLSLQGGTENGTLFCMP